MKTLSYYKKLYRAAKTGKGRTSAFNSGMLNLDHADQQKLYKWAFKWSNREERRIPTEFI